MAPPVGTIVTVLPRCARAAALSLAGLLLIAAPALAADNGEGLLGETDDKIVTAFSFGVLFFFVLVIFLGTWAQSALERRKEARKAASMRHRTGW
jgi:uncharacterized membrane protein YphA (DoxX/SURF4 family)